MTKNAIAALQLQESKRHNQEQEKLDRWGNIIDTVGAVTNVMKGVGSVVGVGTDVAKHALEKRKYADSRRDRTYAYNKKRNHGRGRK